MQTGVSCNARVVANLLRTEPKRHIGVANRPARTQECLSVSPFWMRSMKTPLQTLSIWVAALSVCGLVSACSPSQPTPAPKADASATQTETQTSAPAEADEGFSNPASPAIWAVTDDDTTLYLFGTVHVLKPEMNWRSEAFETAFANAETVYFETSTDGEGEAELARLTMQLGQNPKGVTLSDLLTDEEYAQVEAAARAVNFHPMGLQTMRPWLAAVTLSLTSIIAEGYDPNSGVEAVIEPEAEANGKALRYLETAEQQLRFFADLPQETEVSFLVQSAREVGEAGDMISALDTAWYNGDVEVLESLMLEPMRAEAAEVYDVLIAKRNAAWVAELGDVMREETGVFMVAVGAGHIAGPDSIATGLADAGFEVARVD